ncbi:MAG TPA: regulatory protein RecX [Casimicrobiaceae bacterium]|nr:regulatory protein RecX [Casimicrobiaceae bacterium]
MRDARRKPIVSIRATAIRMLARREYARAELTERLTSRGADATEVTRVLDELEQLGYLSDARFAQMVVTQKAGRYGKRAIAHALTQRRVASPAAQTALDTLKNVDEVADAGALWERRFGSPPKDERERARQIRFLMARGYSLSIALKVVGWPGAAANADADN